ncbi:MAG: hypothetical protein AABX11_07090 [Nanoarchaeota archaeon]
MKNRTLAIIVSSVLLSGALTYHMLKENLTPLNLLIECYTGVYLSSFQSEGVSYVPRNPELKGYAVSLEKQNLLGLNIEKLNFTPYQSTNPPIRLTKYPIIG